MYYNPTLNDIKTHEELMREYNTSFSQNITKFKDYYKIYKDDIPVTTIYQTVKENPIQLINGRYVITYSVTYKSLQEIKTLKFKEIESSFERMSKTAFVISSLGFKIDANETANRNVEGLIKVMKSEGYEEDLFKDYNNEFHSVTLNDLEKMQLEIIKNGQNLYKQKWKFISDINTLSTEEEVANYNILYKNMDFSNVNK